MTLPSVRAAVSRRADRRKSIVCPRLSTARSLHPDVGFVHPPGAVAHSQMRADSLFKLRCVGLDPSEDRRVVDLDAAIEQHELQITVADGKHQIPSHGPKDHLGCELAPLEAITQTHSDAHPIVPHSIIPELRQQRSLQRNPISDGYDPRIGIMHEGSDGSSKFIFDLMEPDRPKVDRAVLEFVKGHVFDPADFVIRSDGVCRLNPEMARMVVAKVSA
jgi:CRISPR associated protein Cas1